MTAAEWGVLLLCCALPGEEKPLSLPQFQELGRQFYKTLEIKARHNEKGRMAHCPKRFWADMTEMKEELK